jgi:hypothetical protein
MYEMEICHRATTHLQLINYYYYYYYKFYVSSRDVKIVCPRLKGDEGASVLVTTFLRKLRANLVPNLIRVFVLCSTQWANNYVTPPNTSPCTSPTARKEIQHVMYNGSNFNNITASFQQQHRSSYSTSSEFLSESSPDDSLGDFDGTKFLTYIIGYYCVSPQHAVGFMCTQSGQPRLFSWEKKGV